MMYLSESAVRKQLVDKALSAAGWRVVNYARWQSGYPLNLCSRLSERG